MLNAFTIDVEDGVSLAMRDRFGKAVPQTDRVLTLTHSLLELLARNDALATFFVLGQVGERFPELIKEIHAAGHEVGVHGYDHRVFHRLTPREARSELTRAKKLLEDLTGEAVIGHRAPCFSIDKRTAWVLDLLVELGFLYDSSIVPTHSLGYGWAGQAAGIGRLETPLKARLWEVPLSVFGLAGLGAPLLGGSYFRLLPYAVCHAALSRVQRRQPAIVYLHPYEIDPEPYPSWYLEEVEQKRFLRRIKIKSAWLRRKSVAARYDRLLSEFEFTSIRTLLKGKF